MSQIRILFARDNHRILFDFKGHTNFHTTLHQHSLSTTKSFILVEYPSLVVCSLEPIFFDHSSWSSYDNFITLWARRLTYWPHSIANSLCMFNIYYKTFMDNLTWCRHYQWTNTPLVTFFIQWLYHSFCLVMCIAFYLCEILMLIYICLKKSELFFLFGSSPHRDISHGYLFSWALLSDSIIPRR